LLSEEDKAIGRKELIEWALGIEMTLYAVSQELGVGLESIRLLKMLSKMSRALMGRCFNIRGDMQSMPEAADLREKMAMLNSLKVKVNLNSGQEMRARRRINAVAKTFSGLPKRSYGRGRVEVVAEFFPGV